MLHKQQSSKGLKIIIVCEQWWEASYLDLAKTNILEAITYAMKKQI
jgi:hypothetical protein